MHILSSNRSQSAKLLAGYLGASYGRAIPNAGCIVIPWGKTPRSGVVVGNSNIIRNKLRQLEVLRNEGMPVPVFGVGRPNVFPCFLRKCKHTKGRDIVYIEDELEYEKKAKDGVLYDFWSGFIRKKAEYRVYFVAGKAISIAQKVPDLNRLKYPRARWVWNHGTGFVFNIYHDDGIKDKLVRLAIKGAKLLRFDYGAVDIILGEDGELYILEYNSAPGLIPRRAEIFARHLRRLAYCNIIKNGDPSCFMINTREIPEVF